MAASGVRLIAVMFADREPDWTVVRALAASGFAGVMLDTAGKDRGGLLAHLRIGLIEDFLAEARHCGLIAGLAGSLRCRDAQALLPLEPDVLGFRGALCAGGMRTDMLDIARVNAMCGLIRQEHAAPAA